MTGIYAVIDNMQRKIVSTHRTLNGAILARYKLRPRYIESYLIGMRISKYKLDGNRITIYQPLDELHQYVAQTANPVRRQNK